MHAFVSSGFRWCQFVLFVCLFSCNLVSRGRLFTGLIGFSAYPPYGFVCFMLFVCLFVFFNGNKLSRSGS